MKKNWEVNKLAVLFIVLFKSRINCVLIMVERINSKKLLFKKIFKLTLISQFK